MSEDTAKPAEESAAPTGESWNSETATLDKIRIERDRAEKAKKSAQAEAKEYAAKLAAIEEEQQRASGELSKVIETRDRELKTLRDELNSLRTAEEERVRSDRTTRLLDAIATRTGMNNRATLGALLKGVSEAAGLDIAPEHLDENAIMQTIEGLKGTFPDIFNRSGEGGSPGAPGLNTANKDSGQAPNQNKGTALAERFNALKREQAGRG